MSERTESRLDLLERAIVALAAIAVPADGSRLTDDELECLENLRAALSELQSLRESDA